LIPVDLFRETPAGLKKTFKDFPFILYLSLPSLGIGIAKIYSLHHCLAAGILSKYTNSLHLKPFKIVLFSNSLAP
jgi:hypothetical protein